MAKREFIEKNTIDICGTIGGRNEFADCIRDSVKAVIDNAKSVTEQDIVKPYLDKLKEQIEQNVERYCLSRESHGMGKVDWNEYLITESKVIELIDNLLSEQGDKDGKGNN